MSSELEYLMLNLMQLKSDLEASWEKTREASALAYQLDGEFRQEVSTDLDGFQGTLRELADNLDTVIEEVRTLGMSSELMKKSMRIISDNEESYKVDIEHIQDEMREDNNT